MGAGRFFTSISAWVTTAHFHLQTIRNLERAHLPFPPSHASIESGVLGCLWLRPFLWRKSVVEMES